MKMCIRDSDTTVFKILCRFGLSVNLQKDDVDISNKMFMKYHGM